MGHSEARYRPDIRLPAAAIELPMRMAWIIAMIAVSWVAYAAPPDWHMDGDAHAHAVFCKSTFVHGYMHGYEQGFHAADLDLNFGRGERDPVKMNAYRDTAGYKREFGDRHLFESGYRAGFRVGYSDGMNQRPFRAVHQARTAALGLADGAKSRPSKVFDKGFSEGYFSGTDAGTQAARQRAAFRNPAAWCEAKPQASDTEEYCAGYARGYRFGYSDGYVVQAAPPGEPRGFEQLPASVSLEPAFKPPPQ